MTFFMSFISGILITFIYYTWLPLLIRFVLYKKPLDKTTSITISIVLWAVMFYIGSYLTGNNYWLTFYSIFNYQILKFSKFKSEKINSAIVKENISVLYHKIFNFFLLPFIIVLTINYLITYPSSLDFSDFISTLIYFLLLIALVLSLFSFYGLLKYKKNVTYMIIGLCVSLLPNYIVSLALVYVSGVDIQLGYITGYMFPIIFLILTSIYYAKRKKLFINAWFGNRQEQTEGIKSTYCRKCGEVMVPADSRYCRRCGTEVITINDQNVISEGD